MSSRQEAHSVALLNDGTVWTWGRNGSYTGEKEGATLLYLLVLAN